MSVSENLIDFNIIENQKENIQSLPSGRSAKALAAVFSSGPGAKSPSPGLNDTKTLNDAIRQEYEIELQSIGESDDPLDIYDRYVKWTLDAYPSAQATPQSGLLPLLERATKAFLSSNDYKNDPRYLRLWLHYIRLFSDAPREVFAFLARHNIGENLALFYEEFAYWLEGAGRFAQAEEVYKLGLQREARPAERLLRKFGEFQKRLEERPRSSDGPSSPALPKVRPALAAKIDPFASVSTGPSDPQAQQSRSGGSGAQQARSRKPKMAIFSDADNAEANKPTSGGETKGWESIGSLRDRKKENTVEAKPWVGETLKSGKRAGTVQKMAVYKDETLSRVSEPIVPSKNIIPQNEKETINPRTGRVERVFVNLEAIYPDRHNPSHEMSLEELRASSRGWLNKDWSKQRKEVFKEISRNAQCKEPSTAQAEENVDRSLSKHLHDKLVIEDQQRILDESSEVTEAHRDRKGGKSKRLKVREIRGETQTIKTNLESPTGPKIRRKNSSEPTMTFHTRAATDEIYDLFNQPLKSEVKGGDNADSLYGSDYDEDDYTSAGESTATGRISATTSEFGDEETTTFRKSVGVQEDNFGDETGAESLGVSEWTEFTNRDVPRFSADGQIQHNQPSEDKHIIEDAGDSDHHRNIDGHSENLSTPSTSELREDKMLHRFVPVPPEDYNPPSGPYRDAAIVAQNRLPFMTPIVEQTESSLSSTAFKEKKHLHTKTPSKRVKPIISDTPTIPEVEDLLLSSPFQEYTQANDTAFTCIPEEESPSRLAKRLKPSPKRNGTIPSHGRVIIDERQCNPVDPAIREKILRQICPSLLTYPGYHDHGARKTDYTADIKKYIKSLSKGSRNSIEKTPPMQPILCFPGANRSYAIRRELGEGGFAPVYLAESVDSPDTFTSDSETDASGSDRGSLFSTRASSKVRADVYRGPLEAIKIESDGPSAWEFYMIRTAHERLEASIAYGRVKDSIVQAHEMHLFKDEGFLVENYQGQGTLIDLINAVRNEPNSPGITDSGLDEAVVMFFAVELFRIVEGLHACGVLHGDLKPDNCLVRLGDKPSPAVSLMDDAGPSETRYSPAGRNSWGNKGITLIDFGRGIDMHAFSKSVQFVADWKVGSHECVEMRECRPWTYQVDLYGLAGIIYILLFGKYMEVVPGGSMNGENGNGVGIGLGGGRKTYRTKESLKRYWERDIWAEVFDLCLNPAGNKWMDMERADENHPMANGQQSDFGSSNGTPIFPVTNSMRHVREKMERWLVSNAEKKGLHYHLKKLENMISKRR